MKSIFFESFRGAGLKTVLLMGMILSLGLAVLAASSDADVSFHFFPYGKIKQLEAVRTELLDSLKVLPERNIKWMSERFGFHSGFFPEVVEGDSLDEWVDLKCPIGEVPIVAVAFMPAVNPEVGNNETYGFPRRFKIEFRETVDDEPIFVIDHTQDDFPPPGLAPAIFSGFSVEAKFVRIVIERGETRDGLEFFALGEVYVFTERDHPRGISNVAPYSRVSTSHEFKSHPYWGESFLKDRISSFGAPLDGIRMGDSDFVARFPVDASTPNIQVIWDLGKECLIGRIEFYPARPPADMLLPHFGYPLNMQLDVYQDKALQQHVIRKIIRPYQLSQGRSKTAYQRPNADLFFAVPLARAEGRYVTLTASSLPEYSQQALFALGEVVFWEGANNITSDASIEFQSTPTPEGPVYPERLIDGHANGKKIMKVYDWLQGLAKRETLERELFSVDAQLAELEEDLVQSWRYSVGGLVLLLVGSVFLIFMRSALLRKRAVRAVREQISRDLHDDVGCSLGTIALGIHNLRDELEEPGVSDEFDELELVTKETAIALEEAVFFTQKTAISLPDLVIRLRDRAEIILGDEVATFTVEGTFPNQPVDFMLKRHLFLLFKEAMHNCSKHAAATQVNITVGFKKGRFTLCVQDNGSGFDPDLIKRGCGLDNMKKRAETVGGTLTISTEPGSGTRLDFELVL